MIEEESVVRIGRAPIYLTKPRYVDYDLKFRRYDVETPLGPGWINVDRIFINLYGEDRAVRMTAWGAARERFGLCEVACDTVETMLLRAKIRDEFISRVTYERVF